MDIADITVVHADGTVTPIPASASDVPPPPGAWTFNPTYDSSFYATVVSYNQSNDPTASTDGGLHFVRYLLSDHLGTAQMEFSAGGWPVWKGQFAPFGQELDSQFTANNYKFTGKERDAESGLDYFGARYMSSSMGRFMSPDPSRLSIMPNNPQTWNRYTYGSNNPLRFKDDNGKWPTEVHNQIIDKAFPMLSPEQRQVLKNISASQDSIWSGGQANALSFEHAMRSPDQSVDQAQGQYNDFVDGEEGVAVDYQAHFWLSDPDVKLSNLSPEALEAFGKALHAVADSTSPAHSGFQKWNWANLWDSLHVHPGKEKTPNSQQMQNAVNAAQNAFNNTFGLFGIQISNAGDGATVTTTQGDGQPCGGNTGVPCSE
jgi:RHS repeat-associated protein